MAEETSVGNIEQTEEAGFPLLTVEGYFEARAYSRLEALVERLLSEGRNSLIIDFSRCVALNSVAIGQFLFLTTKVVEDHQGALFLTNATSVMARVFDLAGITQFATLTPTVAQAVSQLK